MTKDDKLYLYDFKTSNGFYDTYGKQISAYKQAFEEETCEDIDGIGIIRFDKNTGEYEIKDYTKDYDKEIKAFLKLLEFYYIDKKRKLKNNKFGG